MSIELRNQIDELKRRVGDLEQSRPRFGDLNLILDRIQRLEEAVRSKTLTLPEKRQPNG